MKLYTISGSPRGWRVQMAMLFKGLSYELKLLEGSTKEHKGPDYLRINPRGMAPALEVDDQIITDSIAIMAWLDRRHPAQPLFGGTTGEAGSIWSLCQELDDYLRPALHGFIFPLLVERKASDALTDVQAASIRDAASRLDNELDQLETRLQDRPYLCGETPSAADAVAFPEARIIERGNEQVPQAMTVFGFHDVAERFPQIEAWKARIAAMPGYQNCLPKHWKQVA